MFQDEILIDEGCSRSGVKEGLGFNGFTSMRADENGDFEFEWGFYSSRYKYRDRRR